MKKITTLIGAVALVAANSFSFADEINVGGVVWDPDAAAPLPDLSMDYFFYQWFTSAGDAVSDAANEVPVLSTIDPTLVGLGDVLHGVGEVDSINGNTANINSLFGGDLCPNCELTLTFGGFAIDSLAGGPLGGPTFTNGWINFYVDDTPDFSPTDAGDVLTANAADGELWLSLDVVANAFLSSTATQGTLALEFDAVAGLAKDNFDTDAIFGFLSNGLVDAIANNSAIFNNFADLDGNGSNDYYANANGQIDGNTIPEPSTVAIFGLGLLAVSGLRRRRYK